MTSTETPQPTREPEVPLATSLTGPRVLWMSEETPDRSGQGGQRRQYFQIRELVRSGCRVTVLSLAGPQDGTSVAELAPVRRVRTWVRGVPNPVAHARIARALHPSRADRVVVAHEESWDFLKRERRLDPSRTLLDLHNVMSHWTRTLGDDQRADHYQETEAAILGKVGVVTVCSSGELNRLPEAGTARRAVLRHGFDPDEWPEQPSPAAAPVVAAFGSWDWAPNKHGIEWFITQVWPAVRARVPHARFSLAGSGAPTLASAVPGVDIVGRVESVSAFTASARALVVPVLDGVGAPVKQAESLASGRPVLATPDGASAHPDSPATVADDVALWVDTLVEWLERPVEAHATGTATRAWALDNATWQAVTAPLVRWTYGEDR